MLFANARKVFRQMNPTNRFLFPLVIILLFISISSCNKHKADKKITSETTEEEPIAQPVTVVQYPAEQILFHQINLHFRNQLIPAKNSIQQFAIANECDKVRTKFFKERKFQLNNWVGKVVDISSENKGAWAFVRIASDAGGFPIFYQTHYQRWPLWNENSILTKGTKVYQQVFHLHIGDMVTFSGTIVGSLYYKYSADKSIDIESVNSPKIILKFDNIALLR